MLWLALSAISQRLEKFADFVRPTSFGFCWRGRRLATGLHFSKNILILKAAEIEISLFILALELGRNPSQKSDDNHREQKPRKIVIHSGSSFQVNAFVG